MKRMQGEFSVLLKVPTNLPEDRQIKVMYARLIGLDLGECCTRCGGSGEYSFNPIDGTKCFNCGGTGHQAPKLTPVLFEKAKALVDSGVLDARLEHLRVKAARRKFVNGAQKSFFTLWTGLKLEYDWQKAAQKIEPHLTIAQLFNHPMSEHQTKLSEAINNCDSKARLADKATREQKESADKALEDAQQQVELLLADGVALTDRIRAEYEALKQTLEASAS